ncbi:MAG: hypothetical protein H0V56_01385 [Chthoniobacterales bacterium]|nr:hypothetical protein [Chthoniobacterales bacterium]
MRSWRNGRNRNSAPALPFYGLNYFTFAMGLGDDSNEVHVAIAHGLF